MNKAKVIGYLKGYMHKEAGKRINTELLPGGYEMQREITPAYDLITALQKTLS